MSYASKIGTATLYQGTSLTISLAKDDGTAWTAEEVGTFTVTDNINTEKLTKDLVKSGDNLTLTVKIDKTESVTWVGEFKLLAYQTNTGDAEIKVPIGDYDLTYKTTSA